LSFFSFFVKTVFSGTSPPFFFNMAKIGKAGSSLLKDQFLASRIESCHCRTCRHNFNFKS
jgi:hypothetical protein